MSRYGRDRGLECKVYCGDLPRDATEKDLERTFSYYGPIRSVWVARNPPGFAFIEYEDPRDAEDAVRGLDGTNVCGGRVRVEHSNGKIRPKPWQSSGRAPPQRRRPFDSGDRCYECGENGHYAYDCSKYRRGGRRRSRSYERRRSVSRSRSRGRGGRRSYSRSPSPRRYSRSRSRSDSRGRSLSRNAN